MPDTTAVAEAAITDRDPDFLLGLYHRMVEIRAVEQELITLFAKGRMPGFIHSYIGEEATAVGVCAALRKDDYITSTHRGHGHILAKGGDLNRFMAEVFGRETGYCKGKGGSMHIADFEIGILGANGIVGGGIPLAGGAACSSVLLGTERVAVSFFGDGAANIGAFHESLNLAAIWDLPVVFVCENNGYADFIPARDAMRVERVAERGAAYGIPGKWFDGNDVLAAYDATRRAVERARAGEGPTLLEAVTYRWRGHFEGDPQPYRTKDEVAGWQEKDPIRRFRDQLLAEGTLDDARVSEIDAEVRAAIDAAVAYAESSPVPDPREALEDVYTDIIEKGW
jgi:acetoin:2,6-dichlorophenolindophenol oxidoreductase subunit alpha